VVKEEKGGVLDGRDGEGVGEGEDKKESGETRATIVKAMPPTILCDALKAALTARHVASSSLRSLRRLSIVRRN